MGIWFKQLPESSLSTHHLKNPALFVSDSYLDRHRVLKQIGADHAGKQIWQAQVVLGQAA